MAFQPTGFSQEIFSARWGFTEDETWEGMSWRVAKHIASAELPEKVEKYTKKFQHIIDENYFVAGGRIVANSGRIGGQLLNCFVLGKDLDSKEGWGRLANEMIITSMTGGGCGMDFSAVRPRGAEIKGQRGAAPGAVELMKLINGCAEPIKAGGQRRAALMFSLDLDHPDLMEFLDAKLEQGKLNNANCSLRSKKTLEFVNAVKNDLDWELNWKGKYKKIVKAKAVWDKIVQNAWHRAEPGFLNLELALKESNIWYIDNLITTNPCGEIWLLSYDACCLGSLVLFRFVKDGKLDYKLLGDTIRTSVRFLDNVLTVNNYPLPEMKEMCNKLRRIGLGTTGLADMLALLGHKYGSKAGNEFIDHLYRFISKQAYEASVMLAVEKGAFELCDPEKHIKSDYMKRMTAKIRSLVAEHGTRNCALLTQAPVGTGSITSGNCSSGIEPMPAPAYDRFFFDGDERKSELVFHPLFDQFIKEGKDTSHFVGAADLSVAEHMEVQKIVQRHLDNAVSKTINMAEDYPVEEMSKAWLEYLPHLKGTTFYRTNSRKYVKDGKEYDEPIKPVPLEEALRRRSEETVSVETTETNDCPSGICEI